MESQTNFPDFTSSYLNGTSWASMNETETSTNIGNISQKEIHRTVKISSPAWKEALNLYLTPLVLLMGLVTNLLIILIIKKSAFKHRPLAVYFISLAISDTICLTVIALMQIIKERYGLTLITANVYCIVVGYLLLVSSMTSSWYIVCVAVERVLVVKYPMKAKELTSKNKARIAGNVLHTFLNRTILLKYTNKNRSP